MYNVDINMKLYIYMKQLFINIIIIIIMLNIIASKFFINFYLNKC